MTNKFQREKLEIARRASTDYAAADPSDPFAHARATAHFKSGVAETHTNEGPSYGADKFTVLRKLPDGQHFSNGDSEYPVVEYRNRRRP